MRGIAVEHEAPGFDVGVGESLAHDAVDDVVTHQFAGVHDRLGLATHLGAGRHRTTQHVAGGDVDDAEVLDQTQALGALTGTLATEDHQPCGARHRFLTSPKPGVPGGSTSVPVDGSIVADMACQGLRHCVACKARTGDRARFGVDHLRNPS